MKVAFSFIAFLIFCGQYCFGQHLKVQPTNQLVFNSTAVIAQPDLQQVETLLKQKDAIPSIQNFSNLMDATTQKKGGNTFITVGAIVVTGSLLYLLYQNVASKVGGGFASDASPYRANYFPGFVGLGIGTVFIIGGATSKEKDLDSEN